VTAPRAPSESRWAACVDIGSTFTRERSSPSVRRARQSRRDARLPPPPRPDARVRCRDGRALPRGGGEGSPFRPPEGDRPVHVICPRGGFRIAALGIVPDLTLAVSRLAAASAGGKIVRSLAYRLSADDIATSRRSIPTSSFSRAGRTAAMRSTTSRTRGRSPPRAFARRSSSPAIARSAMPSARSSPERSSSPPATSCRRSAPWTSSRRAMRSAGASSRDRRGQGALVPRRAGRRPADADAPRHLRVRPPAPHHGARVGRHLRRRHRGSDDGFLLVDRFVPRRAFRRPERAPRAKVKRTVEGDLGLRVSAPAVLESGAALIESQARAAGSIGPRSPPTRNASRARPSMCPAPSSKHGSTRPWPRRARPWRPGATPASCATRTRLPERSASRRAKTCGRSSGSSDGGYLARCEDGGFFARALAALVPEPEETLLLPRSGSGAPTATT